MERNVNNMTIAELKEYNDILTARYKEILDLPTDEFLSPQVTKELEEIREAMLSVVKVLIRR